MFNFINKTKLFCIHGYETIASVTTLPDVSATVCCPTLSGVTKITTEGVPRTIPRENLVEERKKWFKVMPKERKFIRPLQYFTHDADIS
ncbi:hypothetical protein HanXRQr2_Chr16g0778031 [Helianthus annuus]|uniref:Uncharacterized protein n=1 Tax=Helianthus annuus TaxID=4232 RepID=A0A9K3H113_HELAN|nr:hypothetical protein HanXRQr2_Chr16g0778031 [Helianthus annuus]KAJ0823678.1 hypothetical protein HanPSC8_Chr16g0746471 [Helianthus annuus]